MTKIGSAPIMYTLNQIFGSRHLTISFQNFSVFLRFPLPHGSNKPGRSREPVRTKKQSFTRQHKNLECTLPQMNVAPGNSIQLRCNCIGRVTTDEILSFCISERSCSLGRSILLKSKRRWCSPFFQYGDQVLKTRSSVYSVVDIPIMCFLSKHIWLLPETTSRSEFQVNHNKRFTNFRLDGSVTFCETDILKENYGRLTEFHGFAFTELQCLPHPTGSPGEFCNSKKKGHQHRGKWVSIASQWMMNSRIGHGE